MSPHPAIWSVRRLLYSERIFSGVGSATRSEMPARICTPAWTFTNVADDVAQLLGLAERSLTAREAAMTGDPEGLRSVVRSYRTLADETTRTGRDLAQRPRTLPAGDHWRGAARDEYQQGTTRLVTTVERVTGSLARQAAALLAAATALDSARAQLLDVRNSFHTAAGDLRESAARWGTTEEGNRLIARIRGVCSDATAQGRLEQALVHTADRLRTAGALVTP